MLLVVRAAAGCIIVLPVAARRLAALPEQVACCVLEEAEHKMERSRGFMELSSQLPVELDECGTTS